MSAVPSAPSGDPFVPLDFLKRKNTHADPEPQPMAAAPTGSIVMPEEVVAQEFQLKLYYAGKTSEGVRMKAGAHAMAERPSRPLADHSSRPGGARIDRCGRSGLRYLRVRAARR